MVSTAVVSIAGDVAALKATGGLVAEVSERLQVQSHVAKFGVLCNQNDVDGEVVLASAFLL